MNPQEYSKLLSLLNLSKRIDGRTKFQKIVYILQSHGIDFNKSFRYHYYGPYSAELQLEIEELASRGIVNEITEEPKPGYITYKYEVSDASKLNDNIDLQNKEDIIEYLNEKDSQELELISTLFFLRDKGIKNENALKQKTISLKPHLKNRIEEAFESFNYIESYFNELA